MVRILISLEKNSNACGPAYEMRSRLTFSISFFSSGIFHTDILVHTHSNVVATWFELHEALRTNLLNSVFPSLACGGAALKVTE